MIMYICLRVYVYVYTYVYIYVDSLTIKTAMAECACIGTGTGYNRRHSTCADRLHRDGSEFCQIGISSTLAPKDLAA